MSMSIKCLMFSANPYKAPPRASDTPPQPAAGRHQDHDVPGLRPAGAGGFLHPPGFEKMIMEADLYYVFINIIKNALQAMPQGGGLEVKCSLHDCQMELAFRGYRPGSVARRAG